MLERLASLLKLFSVFWPGGQGVQSKYSRSASFGNLLRCCLASLLLYRQTDALWLCLIQNCVQGTYYLMNMASSAPLDDKCHSPALSSSKWWRWSAPGSWNIFLDASLKNAFGVTTLSPASCSELRSSEWTEWRWCYWDNWYIRVKAIQWEHPREHSVASYSIHSIIW